MGRRKRSNAPNSKGFPVDFAEAEWVIMKVVWDNEPCAAGTVQEALEKTKGWAYSTIKTTMDRMVEKGFLKMHKIRNLQLFSSCISEEKAKKGEFRKMLKKVFDGALTPMLQFLVENERFSQEDVKQLRQLANKAGRSRKK